MKSVTMEVFGSVASVNGFEKLTTHHTMFSNDRIVTIIILFSQAFT